MTLSDFISTSFSTVKSLCRVALTSRGCDIRNVNPSGPLIIMANGPSLNTTIAESLDTLKHNDTMSVNFAPLSECFFEIEPKYHVLADPLFFTTPQPDNIRALYEALSKVSWPMTLLVPAIFAKEIPRMVLKKRNITVRKFNFVGAESFGVIEKWLYNLRLAMPRPRNVLVPALMCGIWLGYKGIFITGADHSWMQTISVDDDNHVISVQPHFYKEKADEQKRVDNTYRNYRLHQIVESFAIAFRSYHTLQRYAKSRGIHIYNSTPDSFIDAFPRRRLP